MAAGMVRRGRPEEAVNYLERAIGQRGGGSGLRAALADALVRAGRTGQALQEAREAVRKLMDRGAPKDTDD